MAKLKALHGHHHHFASRNVQTASPATMGSGPLVYHGGTVLTAPKVFIDYWGAPWATGFSAGLYSSAAVRQYVESFFSSVGRNDWAGSTTQYCQGAAPTGATSCSQVTNPSYVGNPAGLLTGTSVHNVPMSSTVTDVDAENEAFHAADQISGYGPNTIIFVLTPPGVGDTDGGGFGKAWCGWHSQDPEPAAGGRLVTYAFIPYQPDAGSTCGVNFVNATNDSFGHGYLDGYSVVGGHELEEATTDPDPPASDTATGGWITNAGAYGSANENGDLCAWSTYSTDGSQNAYMSNGQYFAVQPLWSNADAGCVDGWGTLPQPATGVTVTAGSTPDSVTVSWTSSTSANVTGYTVYTSPADAAPAQEPANATSATLSGLKSCTTYTFSVVALSATGGKAASASTTTPPTSAPGPPSGVSANPGIRSAFVSWTPGSGCGVTHYTVRADPGGATFDAGGATSAVFPGLTDGTAYSFTVTATNTVGTSAPSQSSNPVVVGTRDWTDLGGNLAYAPAAAAWDDQHLFVFAVGQEGGLWYRQGDGNSWSGWIGLGGTWRSSPAVVSRAWGQLEVFVRGTDNAIWHKWWTGGGWSGWSSLGGRLTSAPAAASMGSNAMEVFARGGDGALWHKWWSPGGGWTRWYSLGGYITNDPGATAVPGRTDVFVRGGEGAVWHKWYTPSTGWLGYAGLGGYINYGPAAASTQLGHVDAFVLDRDRNLSQDSTTDGSSWSGWYSSGGLGTSSPAAAYRPGTSVLEDVFVRNDGGNELWWKTVAGS